MSRDYPNEELQQVIELSTHGVLSTSAGEWAQSALGTVDDIQETVDSMWSNGVEAPTESQSRALENIYLAACRWLGKCG